VAEEKKGADEKEKFFHEAIAHLESSISRGVAFHLAKDQDRAQDLVQETFVRSLAAYDQFNPGTNMKAWLAKILYKFFFDDSYQRKRLISAEVQPRKNRILGNRRRRTIPPGKPLPY
jgi:DNA-directed RNA polymerase specialized sigma24 family protein